MRRKIFLAPKPPRGATQNSPPQKVTAPASGEPSKMAASASAQAQTATKAPAAVTAKPTVNLQSIIGKVTQAKQMVDVWVTKGVTTAPALQTMLTGVLPKLTELSTGQFTPEQLKSKLDAAQADLAAIETHDKEYRFYSLGDAGQTLLNAKKQLPLVSVPAWECKPSMKPVLSQFQGISKSRLMASTR